MSKKSRKQKKRPAPPANQDTPSPSTPEGQIHPDWAHAVYPGLVARLLAALLDGAVWLTLACLLYPPVTGRPIVPVYLVPGEMLQRLGLLLAVMLALGPPLVASPLRGTLGMMVMGFAICDRAGGRARWRAAMGRGLVIATGVALWGLSGILPFLPAAMASQKLQMVMVGVNQVTSLAVLVGLSWPLPPWHLPPQLQHFGLLPVRRRQIFRLAADARAGRLPG